MRKSHNKNLRKLTFSEAIREGIDQSMAVDPNLIVIGEGVPDPKSIFMTTDGLYEKYGENRVFDMPLSENGMTGVCIGAALNGTSVLMIHQRIDFAMLAMDQIVNNAAKWHYMFNGQSSVPIVIRVIIGRGWGQGPQHSQNLQALFAHIPGLKVVTPATAKDAKGMMIAALKDKNPVIFIEHRWLHHIEDSVPEKMYLTKLDKARILRHGSDVTIVANSLMTIEAIKAAEALSEIGVNIEVVDLRSIKPIDLETILKSVTKTKNLIVIDSAWKTGGISGEIISLVVEHSFSLLERAPLRITSPDHAVPTSYYLADEYYQDAKQIALQTLDFLNQQDGVSVINKKFETNNLKDVPNREFHGPF
jgi:acetoin:2,6-dichlorophenolindophenol oxidoreductase subunit beta